MTESEANGGRRWIVGIDIGGTFTDLVAFELESQRRIVAKSLTTPSSPIVGVFDAFDLARAQGLDESEVEEVVHATTLAINTVLERSGAVVGMITTEGFRDVIEVRRGDRYDLYDLQLAFHEPLATRHLRVPVTGRMDARGAVVAELSEPSVRAAIETFRHEGVEAIAVCFLHSYRNPEHEQAAGDLVRRELGYVHVTLSSDVAPIIREYERFSVAVVNAYVAPRVSAYLASLERTMADRGFGGDVRVMKSDGGWFSSREASDHPVRILESGPAAGAIAAAAIVRECGDELAVAFDMGGTTAKSCLIVGGTPLIGDELEIARLERFKPGSGFPLRLPGLDLVEVGAGGGSIASLGPLGLLQVGPQSAGAQPGPACYGRGGTKPTVTDADLLLGYINGAYFAGGSLSLHPDAAEEAIGHSLVGEGFLDVTLAAWGIHDLVNENMARAMRLHCVEHGIDPAHVAIVVTGGAGPVHATSLLAKLRARCVICPPDVGVASAGGLVVAPRIAERIVTELSFVDSLTCEEIAARFDRIYEELVAADPDLARLVPTKALYLRLEGQAYDIRVTLPDDWSTLDAVYEAFRAEYRRQFGRSPSRANRPQIVAWLIRVVETDEAAGERARVDPLPENGPALETRSAYFGPVHGWVETPVHRRATLAPEWRAAGPVLLEEPTSTTVVLPGQTAAIDRFRNVRIESGGG